MKLRETAGVKNGLGLAVAASICLCPRPSYAVLSEITSAASGEVAVLVSTLLAKVEQTASLYEILETSQKTIQVLNEVAATSRSLVRLANKVAKYGPEALMHDALVGLSSVYPELGQLRREVDELIDNGQSLQEGTFFFRYTSHDQRTDRAAVTYGQALVRSSVATLLGVNRPEQFRKLSPAEAKVLESFERAGEGARRTFNESAVGAFANSVRALRQAVREAGKKGDGSMEDQILSASLAARAQAAKAQARRLHLREVETAFQEAARQENKARLESFKGALRTAKPDWGIGGSDAEK